MAEIITSSQNAKIKLARALSGRAKERREAGAFLAEGVRLLEEALEAGWPCKFALYTDGLSERGLALVEQLAEQKIVTEKVESRLLDSLSDTETSQGILAVLELTNLPIPNLLSTDTPAFVLIPDQVRDPGNLGALLRTAAAAAVDAVFIPPETADPFAPKVVRSGMGAHFRLPLRALAWDEIRARLAGLTVWLAETDAARPCWEADLRPPLALIVGGEAEGPSDQARTLGASSISIPMPGRTESLNAAAAGAVLMFEVVRQRHSGGT
jgi:TrmH family RNA methyltransferase